MHYLCDKCGAQFSVAEKLKVHMIQNHETSSHIEDNTHEYFQCEHCNKSIKGAMNLENHIRKYHKIKIHKCAQCSYKTNRAYNLIKHKQTHSTQPNGTQIPQINSSSPSIRSAFKGKVQERAWFIRGSTDPMGALNEYKNRIGNALYLSLKKNPQKFYIAVKVQFFKRDKDGHKIEDSAIFHGTMHTVLRKEDFEEAYQTSLQKIWKSFDTYIRNGSGWILERVENFFYSVQNPSTSISDIYVKTFPNFL